MGASVLYPSDFSANTPRPGFFAGKIRFCKSKQACFRRRIKFAMKRPEFGQRLPDAFRAIRAVIFIKPRRQGKCQPSPADSAHPQKEERPDI